MKVIASDLPEVKINKERWARLDEIDGQTIVKDDELECWLYECCWQAENHPDPELRAMFQRATTMGNLTRKHARALACLALAREPCEDCNDL